MQTIHRFLLVAAALLMLSTQADARPRQMAGLHSACVITDTNQCNFGPFITSANTAAVAPSTGYAGGLGKRPRLWCGWEMRRVTGHLDPALNRAREWLRKFPRTQPAPGVIVVWARGEGGGHVGKILWMVDRCTAGVYSGNNGRGAGVQVRNICNAIGFVRA